MGMTKWPLVCETCGDERYIGTLYGGECPGCHRETTRKQLAGGTDAATTGQSALGDFA